MAQKLLRCVEGHVYDAELGDACPVCAARASTPVQIGSGEGNANLEPAPANKTRYLKSALTSGMLISGALVLAVVPGLAAWQFGRIGQRSPRGESVVQETIQQEGSKQESTKRQTAKQDAVAVDRRDAPEQGTARGADGVKDSDRTDRERQSAPPSTSTPVGDDCDRYAMHPQDLDRISGVQGVQFYNDIDARPAIQACDAAVKAAPNERRYWANLGRAYRAAKDESAAAGAFRRAADLGSVFGAYSLALQMRDGKGVSRDPIAARLALRRAADAGFAPAMVDYARTIADGGGPTDLAEARRYFEMAVASGFRPVYNIYGNFLLDKKNGEIEPAHARELYERAVTAGDPDGYANIGYMYERGLGTQKNIGLAHEQYIRAANAGSLWAMRQIATLLIEGNAAIEPSEAERWLKTAIGRGDTLALVALGRAHLKGKLGGASDPITARQLFEQAAERGNADAMTELGILYQYGNGVPRDYGMARQWYEKAMQGGSVFATANLGVLYEFGYGVPRDYGRARQLFDTAANRGDYIGMYHLGQMAEFGKGVPRDLNLAKAWYAKSGDAGYSEGYWRAVYLIDHYAPSKDVTSLAVIALNAAKAGSQDALEAMLQHPDRQITRELRAAIEARLVSEGAYSGPARGHFDRKFRDALQNYLRSNQSMK